MEPKPLKSQTDLFLYVFLLSHPRVLAPAQDHELWGGEGPGPHQWAHAASQGWGEPCGSLHGEDEYVRGQRHGWQQQHPVMCCPSLRTMPLLLCWAAKHCQNRESRPQNIEINQAHRQNMKSAANLKRAEGVIFFTTACHGAVGGRKRPLSLNCLKVVSACCSLSYFNYRLNRWWLCWSERWQNVSTLQGLAGDLIAASMPHKPSYCFMKRLLSLSHKFTLLVLSSRTTLWDIKQNKSKQDAYLWKNLQGSLTSGLEFIDLPCSKMPLLLRGREARGLAWPPQI